MNDTRTEAATAATAATATTAARATDKSIDPRIARSRRVVQDAAIAEMAEVGYGAMTVEAVAKRAGVSKATVYRQWKSKLHIVSSALRAMKNDMRLDATAPPRDRVTELLTWLAHYLSDSDNPAACCVPALVSAAQYDDSVREFHHEYSAERRAVLVSIVRDGQDSGDFGSGLDPALTAELLVGPIFYRRLMTADPFPTTDIAALVTAVLGPARAQREPST